MPKEPNNTTAKCFLCLLWLLLIFIIIFFIIITIISIYLVVSGVHERVGQGRVTEFAKYLRNFLGFFSKQDIDEYDYHYIWIFAKYPHNFLGFFSSKQDIHEYDYHYIRIFAKYLRNFLGFFANKILINIIIIMYENLPNIFATF